MNLSQLLRPNRRFIEQHLPHIGSLPRAELEEVIKESDVIVVGLNDGRVLDVLGQHTRQDQFVLDLVSMPQDRALKARVAGLCW